MRGNPGNLRRAAAAKSAAAQARAENGLNEMLRRGDADHLPRPRPDRRGLTRLPLPQHRDPTAGSSSSGPGSPACHAPTAPAPARPARSVIRTLTAQLTELKRRHRDEIDTLRQALEAAHGENLDSGAASAVPLPRIERRTETRWRSC